MSTLDAVSDPVPTTSDPCTKRERPVLMISDQATWNRRYVKFRRENDVRQETDDEEKNTPFEELSKALKPWILAISAMNEVLREVFASEQARHMVATFEGLLKRPETVAVLRRLAEMHARFEDRAAGPVMIQQSLSVRSSVGRDPIGADPDPALERPRRKIGFDRDD